MDEKFVYSNCIGTFAFSEGKISDRALFSDIITANNVLEKNDWLSEEKKLVGDDKVLFLGFKNEKLTNVKFTNDIRKLELVSVQLKQYESKIAQAILEIAKSKVKTSVQDDELVVQAISSIQELNKSINLFCKRLREWYGLRNPELVASVSDNEAFLKEVLKDNTTSEMGANLSSEDRNEIKHLAEAVSKLIDLRERQEKYLENTMSKVCPNLLKVAGPAIGAKLLSTAGSLKRLAMLPASTVQLLGAEKSMFNFLRKKTKKMPRFGVLHEHRLVSTAAEKNKGKRARLLADKISIAARVDYFKGEYVGDDLAKQIEDRIK